MNNLGQLAQKSRTPNFDISTLWDFRPPSFSCEKCRGLYVTPMEFEKTEIGGSLCPFCGVQYVPSEDCTYPLVYLRKWGETFDSSDLAHAQSLARVAAQFRNSSPHTPPLRCLFVALARAKHFVHFTTYGISHQMIGALKMTAQRVPVRGVVSNVEGNTLSELTENEREAPKMDIKVYGSEKGWADMPHQKLIVIDGLIAFKGSANLTLNGWRSAALGKDFIEVVTDVGETLDLHNRYFSPVWAELSGIGDNILMEADIPF